MLSVGTVLSDRYEIEERVGAGGMSIVYKAKCSKLQRYVAIKVLREEFVKDEQFVASFRAEALSAASLSHPNIVGIYDVGQDLGYHYIVMEYVEGKTLKEHIEANAPYDNQTILEYGMEILSAIRHAHMKRIIHRDIKPQNIIVTNDNILKVTDFGIARAVDSATIISTGTAIGSVHYFSPEQAKGKYVNETSDLYSCGIVLFELATGKLPFEADSHVTVALKHINDDIPMPTQLNPAIYSTLEAIILKATEKRPELRYQSAEDMLQDMKRLSMNSSYTITATNLVSDQETILMTPEETDFLRKQNKEKEEVKMPVWGSNKIKTESDPAISSLNKPIRQKIYEDGEEEPTPTYSLMVTIAGVLAAVVLIGIVTAFALPWFSKMNKPKVAVVPTLIGKNVELATRELQDKGLEIIVVGEEEKEGIPSGEVIKQSPDKDQLALLGSAVEVIISKEIEVVETEKVFVPDVIGSDFTEAQIELSNANLRMKVERQFDDKVESGIVISQYPMSGLTLEAGEIVTLFVSKGSEVVKISVPNVVNMDENTAIATLQRAGLNVGKITHEESNDVDKGRIIRQGAVAGSEVEQSASVSIVVSKGKKEEAPPPVAEPKLVTKNLTITVPSFLEEKDDYGVLVRLVTDSGETKVIYEGTVRWDQFPITVSVKSTGQGTVETYMDGDRVYVDPVDFGEVTE